MDRPFGEWCLFCWQMMEGLPFIVVTPLPESYWRINGGLSSWSLQYVVSRCFKVEDHTQNIRKYALLSKWQPIFYWILFNWILPQGLSILGNASHFGIPEFRTCGRYSYRINLQRNDQRHPKSLNLEIKSLSHSWFFFPNGTLKADDEEFLAFVKLWFLDFPRWTLKKNPYRPTQVRYLPNTGAGAGVAVHVPPVSRSSMEVPVAVNRKCVKNGDRSDRWNQNQIQQWFFWCNQAIWIMVLGIWIMEPFVISSFSTLQEPPAMCLARCHMHHPEHLGPKIC